MVEYKIVKCDSVVDCSGNYRPMLYFEPSMDIIINMRNNEDILFIDIIDTDQYSGSSIPVVIDIATCNFTYGQQFYTATLVDTQWVGIPKHLGHFVIHKGPLNKCGSVPEPVVPEPVVPEPGPVIPDTNLSSSSQDDSPDDSQDDSQDDSRDNSQDDSQDDSQDNSQDTDTSQKCISKSKSIQNGLIVLVVILVVFLIILSVMRM